MPGFGSGVCAGPAPRWMPDCGTGGDCADWEGDALTSGLAGEMITVVVTGRPFSVARGASEDCVSRAAAGGDAGEGTDNGGVGGGASGDGA